MLKECGLPAGVFNIVNGYGLSVGEPLAKHSKIRKIAYTGSTRTGRAIATYAAETNLKQVQLELGGKSPVIVFSDVNVPEAVRLCIHAVFNNNGQLCTAGSRTYIHEKIYDEFVKEAVRQAQQIKMGSQMDPETKCGPLISKIQFEKVLEFIRHGITEGKMQCGSAEPARPEGYFVQPTIFTDLSQDARLTCEEIFGPVMCLYRFNSTEEVVEMANASEYGLAAGVITKDTRLAMQVSHALHTNTIWINHYHGAMVTAPFGGWKESGFGREGAEEGALQWTQSKSIFIDNSNTNI
jgi:acyl-CoA reductase-like NAD-dependent aldehyde dehydrogenase